MQLIGKQDELLDAMQDNMSLISSSLLKINIYYKDEVVCIDVEVELLYKKDNNKIVLKFFDVQEYSFYYSSRRYFYYVEIFKFFKKDDIFYISFDPPDGSETIAEEDQDYIIAKFIEGYFL